MSVTYKILILPHQKKADGSIFLRIRVTHNGKSKYIKTNVALEKGEYTASGKIKDQDKIDEVNETVKKMRAVTNAIDMYELMDMDVDEVVARIEANLRNVGKFKLDFYEYGLKVASKKSKGTSLIYLTSMNALLRFFNGRHPDITEITVRNLRLFEEYLLNEKVVKVNWRTGDQREINKVKGGRATSLYLGAIRHIYKSARMEFNEPDLGVFKIPTDPFEYYTVPKPPAAQHRDIPHEWVQLMIDQRKSLKGRIRMAIDTFLISYGLMGMNAADLYYASEKPKKGILHYYRKKTTKRRDDKAEMFVRIEPCVKEIMKDYVGTTHVFDYHERYSNDETFTTALNQGLSIWIKRNKLPKKFSFGAARHTWATVARSKKGGIEKSIVRSGLCHVGESSDRIDDIYIRLDWETVWDANAKVLSLLDWK